MAAQTYTLEEAAERLHIAPEVMKRRLKEDWKTVRSFRDGATLRFRANDIDELARSLGEQSDPSLQLAPLEPIPEPASSSDFELPEAEPPVPAKKKAEEPLIFPDDEDMFALPVEEAVPTSKSKGGDSDSDVRLESPHKAGGAAAVLTEEVTIDLAGPGSAVIREGSAARLAGPKSGTKLSASDSNKNIAAPNLGESSEFELSLDADSDDIEIQLKVDSTGDEVRLGDMPKGKGKKSGDSGINLREPVDSGINLERQSSSSSGKLKKKSSGRLTKPAKPDSDLDFELSLEPPESSKSGKASGLKSGKNPPLVSDSDSEFELTLDDPSSTGSHDSLADAAAPSSAEKNNIFETDFEIPPLSNGQEDESGSEAVAIEDSDTDLESSDFDLALDASDVPAEDESASQVVLLEDEVEPAASSSRSGIGSGRRRPAAPDHEEDVDVSEVEIEESAAGALAGVKGRSRFDDEEEEEEEEEGVPAGVAPPAPWGVLPALFLAPAFAIMLLGGLMGFELLQSMWGYHQTRKPAAPLVRGVANMFDMDVKDQ